MDEREPGVCYRTDTPGVYSRGPSFVVKWQEWDRRRSRAFPTYEEACHFREEYVIPFQQRRAKPPSELVPSRRPRGWVYLFQSGDELGPVKIGWSRDPAGRMRDLSVAHPHGLELVGLISGGQELERKLHARFARHRLRGEWFTNQVLDEVVDLLKDGLSAQSVEEIAA